MSSSQDEAPKALVEHFFRHEHANLVAVLTRTFGMRHIDLVEDMVGASMIAAMHAWKQRGVPENPAGWIHRTARNRILDALRREKTHQKAIGFAVALAGNGTLETEQRIDELLDESSLPDSLLRMMFVCCHPALDRQTQVAITLKILCGFSIHEIARGLLISPESAKKRIQRGKKKLAELRVNFEFPAEQQTQDRLASVHAVLYLMFNEGYSTTQGTSPIRDDICEEAARLCHLLCQHPSLSTPESRALLALMLFHASRLDARTDSLGQAVLLEEQDRSQWDQGLIQVATTWLIRSAEKPSRPSRFHLEALIAQLHCQAKCLESTDWFRIVQLYDRLLELHSSPIYRLNRAIAVCQTGDSQAALAEIDAMRANEELSDYFLMDCVLAYIHQAAGNIPAATDAWLAALSYDIAEHQRKLIHRQLEKLNGRDA